MCIIIETNRLQVAVVDYLRAVQKQVTRDVSAFWRRTWLGRLGRVRLSKFEHARLKELQGKGEPNRRHVLAWKYENIL